MRLLIMGAPGAGKGTQAARIAATFELPAISTGAIFRANVANETPLGLEVQRLLAAGELVPDEVTEAIVADRLAEPDCQNGWLLDGFPRTKHQVAALDRVLANRGEELDAVVSLTVDPERLVERLLHRAEVEQRADDNEETIRNRMYHYNLDTEPLLAIYRERGQLIEIDGDGSVDEVFARIESVLSPLR